MTPHITDPNTPSDRVPYCSVPIAARDARRSSKGSVSSQLPNTTVAPNTKLLICPPQTNARRCVYFHSTSPQSCQAAMNRFGSGASSGDEPGAPPRTAFGEQGVTVEALPSTCASQTAPAADGSPPATTPVTCSAVTADYTASRFRVCSDRVYPSLPVPEATATTSNCSDSREKACQQMCATSPTCRYFKPTTSGCVLHDTYHPLSNIGDTFNDSSVYSCSSVTPIRSSGLLSVPDLRPGAHPYAQVPLSDQIPCGECAFLGSAGGCGDTGTCLPPLGSTGTQAHSLLEAPLTETAAECETRIKKAMLQSGGASYSLPVSGAGSDKKGALKSRSLSEKEVVDCICHGVCAS